MAEPKLRAVPSAPDDLEMSPRMPAEEPEAHTEIDLDAPELYLNRELTWLAFNRRVLNEAADERTPLLERVKFLAIVSNNLDEFFMKRIGGLKQQIAAGVRKLTVDGRSPQEQLRASHREVLGIQREHKRICDQVMGRLAEEGIRVVGYQALGEAQQGRLREHFRDNIFPMLTPLAMDPAHPFPFISNLTLNLLVTLRFPNGTDAHLARLKVPVNKDVSSRLIRVGEGHTFVTLDDLIANNLDALFPGMLIEACELFRVTRNAVVEFEEEQANDLLEMIESELRERHFAPIVRLEVGKGMSEVHRGMLAAELGLDEAQDVFEVDGLMAPRDLFELASLDVPHLRDPLHAPSDHPFLIKDRRNIFHVVRDHGSLLLQHPYEPFSTTVERFLRTAAEDPKVLAIKMTLYRTSAEGAILDSLVRAAQNGKQVVVLVELKARFDEAANIRWARRLEQAGIHVNYGVIGLKTHSKLILVVRKDYSQLRRYFHIGTGNYHSGTARIYTDLGLLSCDEEIGQDLTELFNYLTGYSPPPSYRKILVAPYALKRAIIEKIHREIAAHRADSPGLIQMKMNALEDPDVTRALYEAAQAGVKVDLIVRDTCRLRPGLPGLSEGVRVVSIVGRFLEHARILYFRNGGEEEYFIGSADLMRRNLESRVEVVTPVEHPDLRQELRMILDLQLNDQRAAWDMHPDGSYRQRQPSEESEAQSCQEALIAIAAQRALASQEHKEKEVRTQIANNIHQGLPRRFIFDMELDDGEL